MYQYYIQKKSNLGNYVFEQKEGYQLPDNMAACQDLGKWTISDVLSGAKIVEGAMTLKDAKVELEKVMTKVETARKSETYKETIKRMKQYVYLLPEKERVIGWKRYFRNK